MGGCFADNPLDYKKHLASVDNDDDDDAALNYKHSNHFCEFASS
jgi:hypothetical protein